MKTLMEDIIANIADRRISQALKADKKIMAVEKQLDAKERELKKQITEAVQDYIDLIYSHEMNKMLAVYALGIADGISLQNRSRG